MNEKFVRIGEKAGLQEREVRDYARIGLSGLMAVILSLCTGAAQAADRGEALVVQEIARSKAKEPLPERCQLKPDGGHCKALFWKYYFDPATNECKEFVYGGCEGVVPFESREECVQECLEPPTEPVTSDENCGPFPGYPCGSKYYTVSMRDFHRLTR